MGGRIQDKAMTPRRSQDEEASKVRRGKIGGYVDYLSPEDCAYADGVMNELTCPFYEAGS